VTYISIPNWTGKRGFQHYKDRNPPWIKVYTELLANDDYLDLTGDQRAILHGLWLEYASSSCRLRADTRSLTRRLNLRVTSRQLERLIEAGFIELVARRSQAEGYGIASSRGTREETEAETDTEEPAEQSRSKTTTEPGPAANEDRDTTHKDEEQEEGRPSPELVRFNDGDNLTPLADSVDDLREQWASS
jgi:hypothetical protein